MEKRGSNIMIFVGFQRNLVSSWVDDGSQAKLPTMAAKDRAFMAGSKSW
jgi:hypothetical protein